MRDRILFMHADKRVLQHGLYPQWRADPSALWPPQTLCRRQRGSQVWVLLLPQGEIGMRLLQQFVLPLRFLRIERHL